MGKHYEQLTAEERAAIMMMKASDCTARHIARMLHRAPSTIARELKRFAAWPGRPTPAASGPSGYDARAAGLRARCQRFKCRKLSKLATDTEEMRVRFQLRRHHASRLVACKSGLGKTPASTAPLNQLYADDPLLYTTQQSYNPLSQPTTSVDALGQQGGQTYDSAGRLTGVVNAAGVTIERYGYDAQGRLGEIRVRFQLNA